MKLGTVFSGIGGPEIAASWLGWDSVFHCEIEPFPRKILQYYFSNAISYEDIKTTDFKIHRGRINVFVGGFPCQPYSVAGKRKGREDDRHLWPEMHRAIREIQPDWVIAENVPGLVNWNGGLVFEEVLSDLENEGYKTWSNILPASAKGAPHQRYRLFIVAHRNKSRFKWDKKSKEGFKLERWGEAFGEFDTFNIQSDVTNSKSIRLQGSKQTNRKKREKSNDKFIDGLRRKWVDAWEKFPTKSPICSGDDGFSNELDGITFSKWRKESIKAYGNAIVPQVIYEIFKVIDTIENTSLT